MINFRKRLGTATDQKPLNPVELYDTLDRAVDKGPLRPVQTDILTEWHDTRRSDSDVILKLHTGQGKTLVGLLALQAKINETGKPAIYLCPNNFLIEQTCEQARQFGIRVCKADVELPIDFIGGEQILVTSVQKMINGKTKFGLGQNFLPVHTVLMDDAHACIDAVRDAFLIRIPKNQAAYAQLFSLFSEDLEKQGTGTYADIKNNVQDAMLHVPYWAWEDKAAEVAGILSSFGKNNEIKFAWPVLKDILSKCHCIFSGKALEIAPYLPPLEQFGSFFNAAHRIFMSATITDDSFLIKGLRLSPDAIAKPLRAKNESWSGEKMILIPSLIDESLDRSALVRKFGSPNTKIHFGVVALAPSNAGTADWKQAGANVADRNSIGKQVDQLKQGFFGTPLVVVNRYDGIDLPDDTCRMLLIDSKPYSECLADLYMESCRNESNVSAIRIAQTIEQGLGRSVRGEKDYSVILLIGADLVRAVRTPELREHLSPQTAAQIEIALQIVDMSREDIKAGETPDTALVSVINQCLTRDEGWKQYYKEQMDKVDFTPKESNILKTLGMELEAEQKYNLGEVDMAVDIMQSLLDTTNADNFDRGWHMQTMARYLRGSSTTKSNELQLDAHRTNPYVLKPNAGVVVKKIDLMNQKRVAAVNAWIGQFDKFEELVVSVASILDAVAFGVRAEKFERSLNELATALGLGSQRPDKEWGEGPDNLWGVSSGRYLLFECKNEVTIDRTEISKREAEQMNRSMAWFEKYYAGDSVVNVMIIPTHILGSAGNFLHDVHVMDDKLLKRFKKSVREFFDEFSQYDLKNIAEKKIQALLANHNLSDDDLLTKYIRPSQAKRKQV